jgi:hypothetical protein
MRMKYIPYFTEEQPTHPPTGFTGSWQEPQPNGTPTGFVEGFIESQPTEPPTGYIQDTHSPMPPSPPPGFMPVGNPANATPNPMNGYVTANGE